MSDIKFTRQGFENDSTCVLEAKPCNLISKDTNLVFYLSVYKLVHLSIYSNYEVIIIFRVDSMSLSFKKCNIIMIHAVR